jgi:protein arginine kinase activator
VIVCEKCQKREATHHVSVRAGDGVSWLERHLCEECADGGAAAAGPHTVNPAALMQALIQGVGAALTGPASLDRACPDCGITWREFRQRGRLGCPRDYDVFQPEIEEVLARIQGGKTRHDGRIPERSVVTTPGPAPAAPPAASEAAPPPPPASAEDPVAEARRLLDEAVRAERYEEAGALRDRIAELEKGVAGGAAPPAPRKPGATGRGGKGGGRPPKKRG